MADWRRRSAPRWPSSATRRTRATRPRRSFFGPGGICRSSETRTASQRGSAGSSSTRVAPRSAGAVAGSSARSPWAPCPAKVTIPTGGWNGHPHYSPDGTQIVFTQSSDIGGPGSVVIISADGTNVRRLSLATLSPRDADWSPDGSRIVFTDNVRAFVGDSSIVRINVYSVRPDGTDLRQLTTDDVSNQRSKDRGGRWSPDGKTILTDANGSLLLVPVDGSATRLITIASGAILNPGDGAWSPDGEWIVFSGQSSTGFDLYIVRTDGTSPHRVIDTPGVWEGAADWGR